MSEIATKQPHAGHVRTIGLTVTHLYGDAFEIEVRGHHLTVDQPVDAGGADLGPTPTELFAASLAACVGFYAVRFLRRHGLRSEEHTSELQSHHDLVCRLLLEKKKKIQKTNKQNKKDHNNSKTN